MASRLYSKEGVSDLVLLTDVSEDSILDTLRARHGKDLIYTYIGPVLVSVNPFRQIKGLYTRQQIDTYRGKYAYELPPHVFAMAEDAYRSLQTDREDQCIIISGESGAGKTEASKKVMEYMAAVSGSTAEVERVKDQLLRSNPVLEAFGNAKTVRNNNSSRFGKYQEIFFDYAGRPVGGRVTNYLLEKSRVVQPAADERSFHIFYQLCAGLPAAELRECRLEGGPGSFRLLSRTGCLKVQGLDDRREFADTLAGLEAMGISEAERREVFRVVAAVLWLGELEFDDAAGERSEVRAGPALDAAAALLGVDAARLCEALTSRTLTSGSGREAIRSWLSADKAAYARDGLAKLLYFRLFDWVVARVNAAITLDRVEEADLANTTTVGVLDIYGFEIFETNSFEQLMINFVNEKLQQIFIEKTLKSEQDEYVAEGITWTPVEYFNNRVVCDLIEKKPRGLVGFLDEECVLGQGSDASFLEKISRNFAGNQFLEIPNEVRGTRQDFVVKHYAGDVRYSSAGFVDKSKDLVSKDQLLLGESSGLGVLREMFPAGAADQRSSKRPPTAGTQFVRQVNALMDTLAACRPHYIRCIKPNSRKAGGVFEDALSLHQVRYLGLLENVRVRRAGFAFRQTFDRFVARYKMTSDRTWPHWTGGEPAEGARVLLRAAGLAEGDDFQMGRTKVFVRAPQSVFHLEELRERAMHRLVTLIQKTFRAWRARKFFLELREKSLGLFGQHKLRRRVSVRRYYVGDYLHAGSDARVTAMLGKFGDGRVVFCDAVRKINRKYKTQDRVLLLSGGAVYNLVPGKYQLKRRIEVRAVGSVSVSRLADNYVVLHVPSSYDFVVVCERKTELLTALSDVYRQATGHELRIDFDNEIVYHEGKGIFGKKRDEAAPRRLVFRPDDSLKGECAHALDAQRALTLDVRVGDLDVVNEQYLQGLGVHKMTHKKPGAAAVRGGAALPPPPRPPARAAETFARAVFEFEGQSEQELSFKKGQRIKILKQEDDGWWSAEVNGKLGYVPATYVELEK